MAAVGSVAGLGEILQLAYVPGDVEGALKYWINTIGAGPFYHNPHIVFDTMNYMGEPTALDMSSWLGYWGDTQIEIIKQHNDAPSMYKDWRDRRLEGIQHLGLIAEAGARDFLVNSGAIIVQDGTLGGAEFFYADLGGGPGAVVEVMMNSQLARDVFGAMRAAARDWNGKNPIREIATLL
jgi:methylmalonyl-CoA/ethylmalonyl-CoA epimerase